MAPTLATLATRSNARHIADEARHRGATILLVLLTAGFVGIWIAAEPAQNRLSEPSAQHASGSAHRAAARVAQALAKSTSVEMSTQHRSAQRSGAQGSSARAAARRARITETATSVGPVTLRETGKQSRGTR